MTLSLSVSPPSFQFCVMLDVLLHTFVSVCCLCFLPSFPSRSFEVCKQPLKSIKKLGTLINTYSQQFQGFIWILNNLPRRAIPKLSQYKNSRHSKVDLCFQCDKLICRKSDAKTYKSHPWHAANPIITTALGIVNIVIYI